MKPVFALQFFLGDFLDDVQELLGDEAFELTEGFLLKDRAYLVFFDGWALAKNQLANFV